MSIKTLMLALCFGIPLLVEAQPYDYLRFKETSNYAINGKLSFLSDSYLTPLENDTNLNSSKLYAADIALKSEGNWWSFLADFEGGHYSEIDSNYFATRQMYLEAKINKNSSSFYIGRKTEEWSQLEKTWSLSLWEPQFIRDALRPIQQGLSGIWYSFANEDFRVSTFISTIYIPNMGPEYKPNEKGQFEVRNRWVKKPSQEFPFNGKTTQIMYSLDTPEVAKIVNQKSLGTLIIVGNPKLGPWASLAMARKPVNDLVLSYKGILRLQDELSYADVKIVPHVISHEIANFDLGYKTNEQAFIFSHLSEKPFNINPEPGWNYQQFEGIDANAVSWNLDLFHYLDETAKLSVSRMILTGGRVREKNSEMTEAHLIDGMRVRITNAWAIDLQTPLVGRVRPYITGKLHFIRDIEEQGSLANIEINIKPSREFGLILGADIIGVKDNSDKNKSKGFLNQNRANDRIYSGVTYVF